MTTGKINGFSVNSLEDLWEQVAYKIIDNAMEAAGTKAILRGSWHKEEYQVAFREDVWSNIRKAEERLVKLLTDTTSGT